MNTKSALDEFQAIVDRRDALISQFKKTKDTQKAERTRICQELAPYFPRRTDWQKRHCGSYTFAIAYKVIPRLVVKGLHNGRPAGLTHFSDLTKAAKARDELHAFAKKGKYGYEREQFAGEILRQQIRAGAPADVALKLAKEVLQTGMSESVAA